MRVRGLWSAVASVVLACTGQEPGPQDSEATEASTVVGVTCAQPGDNTLRWSCTVTVEPPQQATLVYAPVLGAWSEYVTRPSGPTER